MQQKEIVFLWQSGRHYIVKNFKILLYLQGPDAATTIVSYFYATTNANGEWITLSLYFRWCFRRCTLLAIATGPVATTSVVPGSVAICFAASDYIAILFLLLFIMCLLV
jgi:hypothetical protein